MPSLVSLQCVGQLGTGCSNQVGYYDAWCDLTQQRAVACDRIADAIDSFVEAEQNVVEYARPTRPQRAAARERVWRCVIRGCTAGDGPNLLMYMPVSQKTG